MAVITKPQNEIRELNFTWKISCTHVGSGELWAVPFSPATFDFTLLVVEFCCLSAKNESTIKTYISVCLF